MDLQDNTTPVSDFNNAIPTETPATTSAPFVPSSYGQVESTSPISSTVIDSNTPLDLGDTPFKEPEYTETANPQLVTEPLQTETLNNTFKEPEFTETPYDADEAEAVSPEQEEKNIKIATALSEKFPDALKSTTTGIYATDLANSFDEKTIGTLMLNLDTNPNSTPFFKEENSKRENLNLRLATLKREINEKKEPSEMDLIIKSLISFNHDIVFSKTGLDYNNGYGPRHRDQSILGFSVDDTDKFLETLYLIDLSEKTKKEEDAEKERIEAEKRDANLINSVEKFTQLLDSVTKPSI